MDQSVNLFKSELAMAHVVELLIKLFSGLREDLAKLDGGVKLLVPLFDVVDLSLVKFASNELLEKTSGGCHFLVFPGVLESNVQNSCSVLVFTSHFS